MSGAPRSSAAPDRAAHGGQALNAHSQVQRPKSFLFLQGMATGFMKRLGETLVSRGHAVRRITFNAGDLLFWRKAEGAHYRILCYRNRRPSHHCGCQAVSDRL